MSFQTLARKLQKYDIYVSSPGELKDGLKLYQLLSPLEHFSGAKLRHDNLHQTANCIININQILKTVKTHPKCTQQLKGLSAFAFLQSEEKQLQLLKWTLDIRQSEQPQQAYQRFGTYEQQIRHKQQEGPASAHEEYQNQLDNLYFVSQINHETDQDLSGVPHENDSFQNSANFPANEGPFTNTTIPKEEVVKDNSKLKILRPGSSNSKLDYSTASFMKTYQNNTMQYTNDEPIDQPSPVRLPSRKQPETRKAQTKPRQPKPLQSGYSQNQSYFANTSTPLNVEKPSLKLPPTTHNTHKTSYMAESVLSRNSLIQEADPQLKQLDLLVRKQTDSLKKIQNLTPIRRSLPKQQQAPPLVLPPVLVEQRRMLVEWLIQINLLNSLAIRNFDNLHLICKNGLVFPELINYKKGRTQEPLTYSRNPRKSAQTKANYRKVFVYLQSCPSFTSQLLHRYEYFVPEAQEQAFWVLLKQIHWHFRNLNSRKKQPSSASQDKNKQKPVQKGSGVYQNIRFAQDTSIFKQSPIQCEQDSGSHSRAKRLPTAQSECSYGSSSSPTPEPNPIANSRHSSANKNNDSYTYLSNRKQQYVNFARNTPKSSYNSRQNSTSNSRKKQFCNSRQSINNQLCRSRASENGTPKAGKWMPTVTLEMEVVALNWLKELGSPLNLGRVNRLIQQNSLFQDPLRNGTLLMLVVSRSLSMQAQFHPKPKNILEVHSNYKTAFGMIASRKPENLPSKILEYSDHLSEQLMKGQKAVFYAIAYYLHMEHEKTKPQDQSRPKLSQFYQNSAREHSNLYSEQSSLSLQDNGGVLYWLERLLKGTRHIGDWKKIVSQARTGLLFTTLANILTQGQLKPVHQNPQYKFQCEANITKALKRIATHFPQLTQIGLEWKAPAIANGDQDALIHVLTSIKSVVQPERVQKQQEKQKPRNTASFAHLLQNYESYETSKNIGTQRSEEPQKDAQTEEQHQGEPEVQWMRALGFTGSLSINSGVLLSRLLQKLTMRSIGGIKERPNSRGEMLGNVRRVLKQLRGCANPKLFQTVDENSILNAGLQETLRIYGLIREAYKNSYVFIKKGKSSVVARKV